MSGRGSNSVLPRAALVVMLVVCSGGCGGGDASPAPDTATIGTLAYVMTECRDDPAGYFLHQDLRIRRGDGEVTVTDIPDLGPLPARGLCQSLGRGARLGLNSVATGVLTRLAVSPDGSTVAFEITSGFSQIFRDALPPQRAGMFVVGADGTGLRRLGPPSRSPPFSQNLNAYYGDLGFSPDGRRLAFTDAVQNSDGAEMGQIVILDVATGNRTQVTNLPLAAPTAAVAATCCPVFLDDNTIIFRSLANPDDLNPAGDRAMFIIKTDGSDLKRGDPPHVAVPGATIDPTFHITGDRPTAGVLSFPAIPPRNHIGGNPDLTVVLEIFLFDGENLLQLTNFQRIDTAGALVTVDRQRVVFFASVNPGDGNPTENCQLFSVNRTGGDLRQLTSFDEGGRSVNGCDFNRNRPGCAIAAPAQDPVSRALVFYSSCDPFGTSNHSAGEIFAMRPDGSGLRELTHARGFFRDASDVQHFEQPGPHAYGPYLP